MAFKGEISEEELSDLAAPKLRLFMSVDVVGSTAFKQQISGTDPQGWLEFFASFYTEFPEYLSKARIAVLDSSREADKDLEKALLWKTLGDELVFVADIPSRDHVELHLAAFRGAVREAVTNFVHGSHSLSISFKATAWIAGFPVGNAAILTDDTVSGIPYDFIGPSVDIGFRLKDMASPRRFVVSVELAYLMLAAKCKIKFRYNGDQPLRGVLKERGYPIIWIDNYEGAEGEHEHSEQTLGKMEDKLTKRKSSKPEDLKNFCEAYINEMGPSLMLPFIETDLGNGLEKPHKYEQKRESIISRLRHDVFIVRDGEREGSGDSIPAISEDELDVDKLLP